MRQEMILARDEPGCLRRSLSNMGGSVEAAGRVGTRSREGARRKTITEMTEITEDTEESTEGHQYICHE
jgi:hypothetical protein